MTRIIIDNQLHIYSGYSDKLKERFTYPNPEYIAKKRAGRWLGGTLETIVSYSESPDHLSAPRGALDWVLENYPGCHIQDDTLSLPLPCKLSCGIALRDYQESGLKEISRNTQGVIVMPCGSGKTFLALKLIAGLNQHTLIIVHTIDLLSQWRDRIHDYLGIVPGEIGNNKKEVKQITIATIQTLSNLLNSQGAGLIIPRFGCIILDEAHHCPAESFRFALGQFPAKYRFGLTATPTRSDGLTQLLFDTCGPVIYEIGHDFLLDNGYIHRPTVQKIYTDFEFEYNRPTDFHRLIDDLIADPARNELIISTIRRETNATDLSLVLSSRVDHCRFIHNFLITAGLKSELLIGAVDKESRSRIVESARNGQINFIVSTSIADEGLDIPNLNKIFLVFPSRSLSRVIQRIGRILRPAKNKTGCVIYDFIDAKVPVLQYQFFARNSLYKKFL